MILHGARFDQRDPVRLTFFKRSGFSAGSDIQGLRARRHDDAAILDGDLTNGEHLRVGTHANVVGVNLDAFSGFGSKNYGAA